MHKSNDLLPLFYELQKIMIKENENNWLRGVNLMIEVLTPPDFGGKEGESEAVKYVDMTYRNMVSGNASFADFFIWRDDFEQREAVNKELDDIRANIWKILTELA